MASVGQGEQVGKGENEDRATKHLLAGRESGGECVCGAQTRKDENEDIVTGHLLAEQGKRRGMCLQSAGGEG